MPCTSRSRDLSISCSQATTPGGSRAHERRPGNSAPRGGGDRRLPDRRDRCRSPFMTVALLLICLRAPAQRRRLYIGGALLSALGVIVISPLTWSSGGRQHAAAPGRADDPAIGPLDLSTHEIQIAVVNGLRLAVVGTRVQRLHAARRPRPARLGGRLCATVGACHSTRHPPRPEPRARRRGLLGGGARPWRRAQRRACLRHAAVAPRRRLAGARDGPR